MADILTKDILSIHNDEHFYIEYNPQLAKLYSAPLDSNYAKEQLRVNRSKNYGFKKIEILHGNIGYIDISYFAYLTPEAERTANAAFDLLSNCNAVIIDLRYGLGGQPEMVSCILKHFLKDETLLMSSTIRNQPGKHLYYSEPDSNYTTLYDKPLYILTSYKTFSAGEMVAYSLKNLHRATLVGEQTRGGAHNSPKSFLYGDYIISLPHGKAHSKLTNSNWEGVGVEPDIKATAETSLERAELDIFEKYFKNTIDTNELNNLKWQLTLLKAKNHESVLPVSELQNRVGSYSYIDITLYRNTLYYERVGRAKFPLVPMTDTKMRFKGNDSFFVEFVKDTTDNITGIITYYEDGRIEHSKRNE
ncbi:MAG: S41 family peptidase [Bacteroidota bacterium]